MTRSGYKAKIFVGSENSKRWTCASKQSQTLSPMAAASGVRWDRRLTARLRVDQRLTGVSSRRGPPASSTRPLPPKLTVPPPTADRPSPDQPAPHRHRSHPHHCVALDSPPFLCRAPPAPPPKASPRPRIGNPQPSHYTSLHFFPIVPVSSSISYNSRFDKNYWNYVSNT